MKVVESPLCFDCPIRSRVRSAPEIAFAEPVQQVVGYIEDFVKYRDDFIDSGIEMASELRRSLGDEYSPIGGPFDADDDFVYQSYATKQSILEYLDLLPADISAETTLELGRCAHKLANGICEHTAAIPSYAEQLADMRANGQIQ